MRPEYHSGSIFGLVALPRRNTKRTKQNVNRMTGTDHRSMIAVARAERMRVPLCPGPVRIQRAPRLQGCGAMPTQCASRNSVMVDDVIGPRLCQETPSTLSLKGDATRGVAPDCNG